MQALLIKETSIKNETAAIPVSLQTKQFPSLDGLRAMSILLVVIAHLTDTISLSDAGREMFTRLGLLGVQVFFVISGFLITTLLLKERIHTGIISLKQFYLRRVLRILPVAFLYLLCMLLLNKIFHLDIPIKCFIGAAFFLGNLSLFQGSWYTAHYWSLSVEEQYYLLFPFLLKKLKYNVAFILIGLLLLIMLVKETAFLHISIFPDKPIPNIVWMIVSQSDGVLIGSLLSIAWFKNYLPINFINKNAAQLMLLLPLSILIFGINLVVIHSFNSIFISVLIALLIVSSIVNEKNLVFRFLNNNVVRTIGKLSYSIYIWQQIFTSHDGKLGSLARLPVNIILIAVVSYGSYYFFEKRFLGMKETLNLKTKQ